MKQKLSTFKQVAIGAGIVYFIWLIGFLAMEDPLCLITDFCSDVIWWIKDIIAVSSPFIASLSLIVLAVVSKKYDNKYIYYSALTVVCIPIFLSLLISLDYDATSLFSFLVVMPIYTVFYPFSIAAEVIYDLSYTFNFGYIFALLLLIVGISVVVFTKIKNILCN